MPHPLLTHPAPADHSPAASPRADPATSSILPAWLDAFAARVRHGAYAAALHRGVPQESRAGREVRAWPAGIAPPP